MTIHEQEQSPTWSMRVQMVATQPGADAEDIGFFIIEHAAEKNPGVADGMMVHFEHTRDGGMSVVCDGRRLDGAVRPWI